MYLTKEKSRYSECYRKVLYAGPKHFDKLEPQPDPTRLTSYNSVCNTILRSYS